MKSWLFLKQLIFKKISVQELLLLWVSLLLIVPFIILSYFNNPSIDDYSFVFNTSTQGFWKAQLTWYQTWTGRYFSTFLLSAHPLLLGSLFIYKVLSLLLIVLTVHSLYSFISAIFSSTSRIIDFVLSIFISFCFFNGMPNLVQGIYWAPGAITYQLANILLLYLGTRLIKTIAVENTPTSISHKLIISLLIIAICGLNETSMIVADLLLACICLYDTLKKRKIRTELLLYIALAVICSLIVIACPGNAIRDKDITDVNKHQAYFTIISSIKTSYHYIISWFFSSQTILTSFLVILFYMGFSKSEKTVRGKKTWDFIFVFTIGCLLIISGFSAGFWSTGIIPPARTINVSYWVFICTWIATLLSFLDFFSSFFPRLKKINYFPVILICCISLFLYSGRAGNYNTAVKDILSGKAYGYNKEFLNRERIMKEAPKDSICTIPSYSKYPKSIFNEDIGTDEKNWWNYMYAHYYHIAGVRVEFKEPENSVTYFLNFENGFNQLLDNQNTFTKEVAFSSPNSSLLPGNDSYSATFKRQMKDIGFENIIDMRMAHISARLYSTDSTIHSVLVFCINDPVSKKDVYWYGKDIKSPHYAKNQWVKEECFVSINKQFINPENKIVVYIWNKNNFKLYVDDLRLSIY